MRTGLILASLIWLSTSSPAVAGQVFTVILDGYTIPCTGRWESTRLDMSDFAARGATLVMDSSGSFSDAALLTDDGGGQWAVIVEGHVYGPGRFTVTSDLKGDDWIHVRGQLHFGGVCEPGQHLALYATMKWSPKP